MGVLEHYRVKIEALSPIYIGSGEKLGKKEYVYLPWDQLVIVPDIHRIYADIQKKGKGQDFLNYMLNNRRDSLGNWLKQAGYKKKDYNLWKRYELSAGDAFLTATAKEASAKEICCFMKDPYGLPYVPGSSIKGMIRTALLAWEVRHDHSNYTEIIKAIKTNATRGRRNTLANETTQLEQKAFHTIERPDVKQSNAVCCNLSGLIIGDSDPIPVEQLVLTQKVDYTLDGNEKPLPILRETLCPGTKIYFDLTIDTQVCPYSITDILDALEEFQRLCYDSFYKRFRRGSKESGIVWLGGGAGFLSKTILYPILGEEAYQTVDQVLKETLGKNYEKHKHYKNRSLKIAPHVCKCAKYRGELYDMGMGRIEVLT